MRNENVACGEWQELMNSFSEEWKENEEGNLILEGEVGNDAFEFIDYGKDEVEWDKELVLRRGKDRYILQECILKSGIEYFLRMPVSCGVLGPVYGPDGSMSVHENLFNLPRKIDMDKTVELFLKQVVEKRFTEPVLVRAE